MADSPDILISEILGRTITNVSCKFGMYNDWLETAYCLIELDGKIWFSVPFSGHDKTFTEEQDGDYELLFKSKSDVNNPVIGQKIVGFVWPDDSDEKCFLELSNGYFISETTMSPYGTGAAGVHLYKNLEAVKEVAGDELVFFRAR